MSSRRDETRRTMNEMMADQFFHLEGDAKMDAFGELGV
jgi:hypothetical protein